MHKYLQSAKTRIRSTRSDTQRAKAFILKNNYLVIPHKIWECAYQGSKCKIKSQLYWIVSIVIGLIRPAHDVLLSFGMGQLWVWSYFQSSLRLTENNKGYPALPVDTTLEYTGRSWCILSYQRRPCCKIRRKSEENQWERTGRLITNSLAHIMSEGTKYRLIKKRYFGSLYLSL